MIRLVAAFTMCLLVMICDIMSRQGMLWHGMSCQGKACYGMACRVKACHVMLCHVMHVTSISCPTEKRKECLTEEKKREEKRREEHERGSSLCCTPSGLRFCPGLYITVRYGTEWHCIILRMAFIYLLAHSTVQSTVCCRSPPNPYH